jgi:hypothetical protein
LLFERILKILHLHTGILILLGRGRGIINLQHRIRSAGTSSARHITLLAFDSIRARLRGRPHRTGVVVAGRVIRIHATISPKRLRVSRYRRLSLDRAVLITKHAVIGHTVVLWTHPTCRWREETTNA